MCGLLLRLLMSLLLRLRCDVVAGPVAVSSCCVLMSRVVVRGCCCYVFVAVVVLVLFVLVVRWRCV